MLDENGKPTVTPPAPEVDAEGKPIVKAPEVDANGNPVVTPPPTPKPEVKPPVKEPSTQEVDALTGFIKDAGLDVTEVIQAVTTNDGLPTPAILKALIEKHGESVANLIVAQMKQLTDVTKVKAQERDNAVYKLVEAEFAGVTEQGGKETWLELATWAKDNVEVTVRKEINALLERGGLQAELAVRHLVGLFKGRQGGDMQSAVLLDADGVSDQTGLSAVDKKTYTIELNKLLEAGHDYDTSVEVKKLNARRLKGLKRGL